jgi:hypothetical protein
MFFRLFVSEENESPLKCIDSYRNFGCFFIFQASSISEDQWISSKIHTVLFVIVGNKDQSSLVFFFWWLPSK